VHGQTWVCRKDLVTFLRVVSRDRDLNYLGEVFDIGYIPSRVLSPLHILSTVYNFIVVATQQHPGTSTPQSFLFRQFKPRNAPARELQGSPFTCTALSFGLSIWLDSLYISYYLVLPLLVRKSQLSFIQLFPQEQHAEP
jgi:hypothetical protein